MAQKTLLTLEQFFAMPDDGHDYELVHGELVEMPPQDYIHELVKSRITVELGRFLLDTDIGSVFPETGTILDAESWRKPDVAYIVGERLDRQAENQPIEGAPDLCVEVVSPSNTHRDIAEKTAHFLNTGASVVWIVYPTTKEIHIITKNSDHWLGPDDVLTQPDLLPGFEIQVRRLFQRK